MKKKEYEIIELELDLETIGSLAIEAHRRDMKLNDFIIEILVKYVEKHEFDEKG